MQCGNPKNIMIGNFIAQLKLPQFRFQELLGVLALKRGQNAIISL